MIKQSELTRISLPLESWKAIAAAIDSPRNSSRTAPNVVCFRRLISEALAAKWGERVGAGMRGLAWVGATRDAWLGVVSALANCPQSGAFLPLVVALSKTEPPEHVQSQSRKLCQCDPNRCQSAASAAVACRRELLIQVGEAVEIKW